MQGQMLVQGHPQQPIQYAQPMPQQHLQPQIQRRPSQQTTHLMVPMEGGVTGMI